MKTFTVGEGRVWSLTYTPDGQSLVIQEGLHDFDQHSFGEPVRVVRWWDWQQGIEEYAWPVQWQATFSPDQRLVVACVDQSEEALYEVKSLRGLRPLWRMANEFAFSRDNRVLAAILRTSGESPETSWEDLPKRYHTRPVARPENAATVAFSPDNSWIARGGDSQEIILTPLAVRDLPDEPEDGDWAALIEREHNMHVVLDGDPQGWGRKMLFLDDQTLLNLSWPSLYGKPPKEPSRISIWDIPSRTCKLTLPGHKDRALDVALSADRSLLMTGSKDGMVRLWDRQTWTCLKAYSWDIGEVSAVAFSPDGMTCAAGGEKGRVVVWDVET